MTTTVTYDDYLAYVAKIGSQWVQPYTAKQWAKMGATQKALLARQVRSA